MLTPSFVAQELSTLARWQKDQCFEQTLAKTKNAPAFTMYDGPPFANGKMHYGHLLTGFVKDFVGRYNTMQNFYVERVFGWDTHGLPAELEAMRRLGLKTTDEVHALGLETFNNTCRKYVMQYAQEWEETVHRQARWVDFENGYKTLDTDFMESTVWAFKKLYDKGLVYEDFKVLPYCWHDQTPLSAHELTMDGEGYKNVTTLTATVGVTLKSTGLLENARALFWTTTPWTLPSNLLVALNAEHTYELYETEAGDKYLLGEHAKARYPELAEAVLLKKYKGKELENVEYTPLFDYFKDVANAFRLVCKDWVQDASEAGTGLVHLAPGFGELDKLSCDEENVKTVVPVDEKGCYENMVKDFAGLFVLDANEQVLAFLNEQSKAVFEAKDYTHAYPHCWRCNNPLLYRGVNSWFVKVTALQDSLLAKADEVTWVPESAGNQFKAWLAQVKDWGVSRNRFWGTPLPVWKSDDENYPRLDVYGSLEELEQDFGMLPRNPQGHVDLHRPYVDTLVRCNPDDPTGKSKMRRVPEVLDVWFDSGAMAFAQHHYPFENEQKFEQSFPADFVVEYVAQTRGWFYTLHVLAVALFDRPAFKTCLAHGVVLGDDGTKMSKSKRNYPEVSKVFDSYGSDAMRWYLLSSPLLRGGTLAVSEEGLHATVRDVLGPLTNVHQWYLLAKNAHGVSAEPSANVLDVYLQACYEKYAQELTLAYASYRLSEACELTLAFLDTLANWHVRCSRKREGEDMRRALGVLEQVLAKLDTLLAPLLPYTSEHLYTMLGFSESVHLQSFPQSKAYDTEVLNAGNDARLVVSAGLALRKKNNVRLRQPLASATVASDEDLALFKQVIEAQLNVKDLFFTPLQKTQRKLKINARQAGPRLGKQMQETLRLARENAWEETSEGLKLGEVTLLPEEYEWQEAKDESLNVALWKKGKVTLAFELTQELELEGLRADLARVLLDARKARGLKVGEPAEAYLTVANETFEQALLLKTTLEHECSLALTLSSGEKTEAGWA